MPPDARLITALLSILASVFLCSAPAAGASVLHLADEQARYELAAAASILIDESGDLTIEDVARRRERLPFRSLHSPQVNLGLIGHPVWVRVELHNAHPTLRRWMIDTRSGMDLAKLYVPDDGSWEERRAGNRVPKHEWDVPAHRPLFALDIAPGQSREVYLRYESSGHLGIRPVVTSETRFARDAQASGYVYGLYYGAMLVMALYNLFLFFSIRDRLYLVYVLFIASATMMQMSLDGFAHQYLWPGATGWVPRSMVFFVGLASLFSLEFTRGFLRLADHAPLADRLLRLAVVASGAYTVFVLFGALPASMRLANLLGLVFVAATVMSATISLLHGQRSARFFALAWAALAGGVGLTALKNFGLLDETFVTSYGVHIGTVLEVTLLSFALADQINHIKREKEEAQALALANLRKADRLKDEFLANTSHELRTPLHGIIGIAESLLDGTAGTLTAKARRNLAMVVSSGKRLASLVNDLLDFSRLKNEDLVLRRRPVHIRQVAEIVLAHCEPLVGSGVRFVNDVPEDLPACDGDEDRLQQILHNLVGNAVKFTPSGEIRVSARRDGDRLEVSVTDTGVGIPPDKQEVIFESFQQADATTSREHGGSGLGLTISRRLVELHGGSLGVESRLGHGARFHFTIPLADPRESPDLDDLLPYSESPARVVESRRTEPSNVPEQTVLATQELGEPQAATPSSPLAGARVLVVDDEPVNVELLDNILTLQGCSVRRALSGPEALEILEAHLVDLVLLDVMMPRMTGYEVCRRIREHRPAAELPVIMLTAKNQVSDLVHGLGAGANDYVVKPFSKRELIARLQVHLELAKINGAYGRFVPREFLKLLDHESIVQVRLGDQVEKDLTIMFADIRSFTQISERLTPQANFTFLNAYLNRMSPVIRKHGGFIDKYIGDGIMALFPRNAADAVDAAVEMMRRLEELNTERSSDDDPVSIGIGIHSGTMILGTIGEARRMEGTVISDAVNVAARIEGLTKQFGAGIVLSEAALKQLGDAPRYQHRFLGRAQVKGKSESVPVFEILDGCSRTGAERKLQTRATFERALAHFYQNELTLADELFNRVLAEDPDDKAALHYLSHSSRLLARVTRYPIRSTTTAI